MISLLSGVALFLFGMSLMGDGLKKVAGSKLEIVLYKLTSNSLKGLLLGTGVTAVIQSSSATSVMVVGFVNSGMMKVRQAIAIILGAILGTSVTGWILCLSSVSGSGWVSLLSTSTLTGICAIIGILLYMFPKVQSKKNVGSILLGFSVLMFGMQAMSTAVYPLRESAVFLDLLTRFSNPILGIIVGMLFTCLIQSASAAVGILQALAMTGTIDFSVAFPLIMGIAIGAALPVLLSALGANVNGKRTAYAYLLIDVIGVVVWGSIFYLVNAFVEFPFFHMTMTTVSIALLNTLFRFATVVLLMPLLGVLEKQMCRLFPEDSNSVQSTVEIDHLEERFINHPALAIEQSRIAVNAMARRSQQNLVEAFSLLDHFDDSVFENVICLEDIIDRYEDRVGSYLVKITAKELDPKQTVDTSKFLHTIGDFERMSDHAVNIAEAAREIHAKKVTFSGAAQHELNVLIGAVTEIIATSIDAFVSEDMEGAYRVEPLEELIDTLCDEMKLHHIDRVKKGVCTLNQGFVFNDLLTNLERIADHCSNVAVAMIELASEEFDTHEYMQSLKEMKNESFDRYFGEYRNKYVL